jgi:valyl-tRNA synthetase
MCCTFGDTTDVSWWYQHKLELIQAIGLDGRMTEASGELKGLPVKEARQKIIAELESHSLILDRQMTIQTIRVHERCDTPIEYVIAKQWFVNILDHKEELLKAGEKVNWYPDYMHGRYRAWVENLNWDCVFHGSDILAYLFGMVL